MSREPVLTRTTRQVRPLLEELMASRAVEPGRKHSHDVHRRQDEAGATEELILKTHKQSSSTFGAISSELGSLVFADGSNATVEALTAA